MVANMIMASSKTLITSSIPPTPKLKFHPHPLPQLSLPKIALPKFVKLHQLPALLAAATTFSLAHAPPSLAVEIEKAALFDFNLTSPIIALEFLFLMFALDKVYYTPLGNFMDERDAAIREKLNSVKDTSTEVKQLEDQAAAVMKAARAEISAALNKMKKETQIEVEQKLAEGRKKVETELQEALASLENQKEETVKALDSQIAALSEEIVKKVLPVS
ncbi:ATP synthase subunit b', chloroplastic [Sesamum alatum]|uniref:ATP synthase subunit b', chloroplastic n=1 Tax=Sesamum alatum TaxID=300844 RepID=A0AAE2CAW4_9LAMI|nr:ATP synthase subunit b', chloroplastic [Sesamum alatum]